MTYPNDTIAEYTYDALNRLINLVNKTSNGGIISSYTYTLDAGGNRTRVEEHTGRVVEYEYDDTDKLLEEKITNPDSSSSVISYTYDAVGNRLTKTDCTDALPCVSTTYQYDDNNRLIQEDDITYSYDDNGNLKEKTSAEEDILYFYDDENHLTRVETTRFGVTIVVEYEYDAEGNRVRKSIDDTIVITYLVDANRDYAQVLEERDSSGNLLVRYVYGHDLISQTRGGATSYYHYDGLDSTRALTNSAEAVTDTYNYDAFGNLLDKTGSTTNTHLFTGEFFDANIGFYYLRARYLNPAIGRFVTMDTFAGRNRDPYSLHKYLYAHANPINMSDPSGQSPLLEQVEVGAIIGMLATWTVYNLSHPGDEWDFRECFIWTGIGAMAGGFFVVWTAPTVATVATTIVPIRGKIPYGDSELSRLAIEYRRLFHVTRPQNVAVFEYKATDGTLTWIARKSMQFGGKHAERLIAQDLARMGVDPSQVTRIYSELQPCSLPGAYCSDFIARTFTNAAVTYSFEYGTTQASRDAGMAVFEKTIAKIFQPDLF